MPYGAPPTTPSRRIKAFRAPYPGGEEPAFGFGRTSRLQARRSLRHTLSSDVRGLVGPHAGLHVLGGSLVAVNGERAGRVLVLVACWTVVISLLVACIVASALP